MAIWCLLDAHSGPLREIGASTRVAGLSLIARHLRMAQRQGWHGAVIVVAGCANVGDEGENADTQTRVAYEGRTLPADLIVTGRRGLGAVGALVVAIRLIERRLQT